MWSHFGSKLCETLLAKLFSYLIRYYGVELRRGDGIIATDYALSEQNLNNLNKPSELLLTDIVVVT